MASPSCPSTAVSDVDSVVHLESWAAQTTEHWTTQVRDEWRRQKRINNSLRFRARKKNELLHLRSERERLETEVQRRLSALNSAVARSSKKRRHCIDPR